MRTIFYTILNDQMTKANISIGAVNLKQSFTLASLSRIGISTNFIQKDFEI